MLLMMVTQRIRRRTPTAVLLALAVVLILPVAPLRAEAQADEHELTGYASWYAGKFQGRTTANGETFDTNQLTAAHKTLPFNTIVEVTHVENGRSVIVRINDRGPFVTGRVIDLSRAAADAIAMTAQGIARVRLRIVSEPAPPVHRVQVASFASEGNARRKRDRLRDAGLAAEIERAGSLHRVVVPGVRDRELADVLAQLGRLGYPDVLVRAE